ncbi:MAG: hypothetical protein ACOVOR_03975 [Rhabdochlamydiaceae bacterium]
MSDSKNIREIEDVISKAIKKVNGRKENDLCKYLPMSAGGYMHHFTLRKMKHKQPQELLNIIQKFIINADKPSSVTPKQRAARGSRKKRDQYVFSKTLLEKMLGIARQAGDKEMVALLSPKKSLASAKRELISSIRQGKIELELWNSYVESASAQQLVTNTANEMALSK